MTVPTPPRIVHLSELPAIPGPGSLTWSPVRLTLGIRAFGANAYTAQEAGQDVVEPHTEETDDPAGGHQELYYVAVGRARFTVDGEEHDAPAGTYVFLPDPASHRHAVAVEAPTTVLSFGGPPTFEPSAWEWAFQASPLIRADPERAREILDDGLKRHPQDGALHYNLACLAAVQGRRDEALVALGRAIELRPESTEWARDDADLASLREEPEFRRLTSS
jgi:Cupin domain